MSITANRRKARREECTKLVLFLLGEKPGGWHVGDLHQLVTRSMRSSISRNGMGLIMRPYFINGTIVKQRISDNGQEVSIWRKQ